MSNPESNVTIEELVLSTLNWLSKRDATLDSECQHVIEHWNEPEDERERRLRG